ncbi:MAG TPA: DUF1592 domain-containing protein [Polyangia bacterium]|nr:DUF1592 domain-containing protein [Polyangia bacterium]
MTSGFVRLRSFALAGLAVLAGCTGKIGPGASGVGAAAGSGSPSGTGGIGPATGTGGVTVSTSPYVPARVRRLTNAEYDASVQALLGTTMVPSVTYGFPPDTRQGPAGAPAGAAFTVNDAQRVDPVLADKLDTAAQALVTEARANGKLAALSPCANATSGGEDCARTFVQSFGAKAYRRPLGNDEIAGLTSVYHVGADGYTYADGIDLLTRVLLQSAGFLYLTELGEPGATGSPLTMTGNEIAGALAYLLTSGPPDDALLAKAAAGALATSDGRESEARRLLSTPAGHARLVRVVREWLGIEDVAHREKASSVYPDFAGVSQSMENESRAFVDEVLNNSTGTLTELLTADWTIVDAPLAAVYGVTAAGTGKRTSLAGVPRRGILTQGAFLSVFATNNGSHPVFRGVAIMRRLACLGVQDPGALGIVVSFPAADPTKTTRERFESHAADAGCASCHKSIDSFGFALEEFDGMGKLRSTDNGRPVDSTVTISVGSDVDGTYADGVALANALAGSASVKTCLARQMFRSVAGRSDGSIQGAEDDFVDTWKQLPTDQQDRVADVLVAWVRSPKFVQRRTP